MKQFIIKISFFILILCILSEIIIRIFHLVPEIPERYIDEYGIQRYKPGQSGFYTKAKEKWNVNSFGWLGVCDIDKDTIISIIGDSYIENLMNPIECNQGSILKSLFPNYAFFEAGRSGVSFIEAMEISKMLEVEVAPKYQLIYLSEDDFYESISEIERYNDRLQISVENQKLLPNPLLNPGLKKILYNFKLVYYLYLKYPIFVDKHNMGETSISIHQKIKFNKDKFNKLFDFCSNNYNLSKLIFVFHPNTDDRIIALANKYGVKSIILNSTGDNTWGIGIKDDHWSCYGHNQACKQVKSKLNEIITQKILMDNKNNMY